LLLIGLLVAAPLIVLPFIRRMRSAASFALPSLGSIAAGITACLIGKKNDAKFEWRSSMQRSSLTVLFAWGWGILFGAFPFVISKQLALVQALFEAVSGWTTTGLSVMDVSVTPHIFLFHRSFMQFCGGLGFVMMMIMLVQDKQSINLYNAEGHPDKLMPNLKKTAQTICLMYNAFLFVGTAAYVIAGMGLFDAINHTMCALSTGGFSTKLNSIGEYNSFPIEIITVVLMLIGTTNFAVLQLMVTGKWKQVFRVSEVKFMLLLLLLFVPITALSLMSGLHMGLGEGCATLCLMSRPHFPQQGTPP
jgi:trk system potassium uptake protein TrkH